jgi:hypothetical protein
VRTFAFVCYLLALLCWFVDGVGRWFRSRPNSSGVDTRFLTPIGLFLFLLPTVVQHIEASG